ncbi:hypothetical protein LOAG_16624 [Loa loa]|uniref:Uncharacterized protein n=1 Tax=Loa loa TaxID=7209 RepID=A0A1S0ULJ3_LOALO|nr:hypothetical protein LOAG_16624 [Loa loa]EJD76449.1 hypothetical protein LOAG_16624 [Loa loa]
MSRRYIYAYFPRLNYNDIFPDPPSLDNKLRYPFYSLNAFPVAYPQFNDLSTKRQLNYYRRHDKEFVN